MELVVATVPPHVRLAGADRIGVTSMQQLLPALDSQAERSRQHFETLLLLWVYVFGRDKSAGADMEIELEQLTARIA